MKKINSALLLIVLVFPLVSSAQVKYRHPLGSSSYISYWYDHDSVATKFKKYNCSTSGGYDGHTGNDFPASSGNPIYSGAHGELYYRYDQCLSTSGKSCGGGYGNHARMKHTDGKVTIYAHMKKGTVVGQQSTLCAAKIGEVGCTGNCTGNHVHFEIWSDKSATKRIDPYSGDCSQTTNYWYKLNSSGLPATTCQS